MKKSADTPGPVKHSTPGLKMGTSGGGPVGEVPTEMTNTSHKGTNQVPKKFREKTSGPFSFR